MLTQEFREEIAHFVIPGPASCIHCGSVLTNRILDRAGAFTIFERSFWCCFDCAVLRFENDDVQIWKAKGFALLCMPEWTEDQRAEITEQIGSMVTHLQRPNRKAEEEAQYQTYNARVKYWIDKERSEIEEYRARRLAGFKCPIPDPVDFNAPIPQGSGDSEHA